jgi:hypothetical protein
VLQLERLEDPFLDESRIAASRSGPPSIVQPGSQMLARVLP